MERVRRAREVRLLPPAKHYPPHLRVELYPHCEITRTYIDVLLVVDQRRQASLGVVAIGNVTAEVPQGSVQHPGCFQVGRVHQVVAALWVQTDPLTVGC